MHKLLVLLAVLCATVAKAQMNVRVGEHFMANSAIKKLHVCVEDHSVWLLSAAGKVYVKKVTDTDFTIYPATAALNITGVTGFNADEMYFISGAEVLQITNGNQHLMPVPFPGVTRINDIAAVHGKDSENILNQPISNKDYLSVATNKDLYFSIRGSNSITERYRPRNPYYFSEPDFQISYSGFKHETYRYLHPANYCGVEGYHENDDMVNGVYYWSAIPEKAPYPSKINVAILGGHLFEPFRRSDWKLSYNTWATDDGVYHRAANACIDAGARKHLAGEKVNTLENIYALTPIRKQDFILAGSNTGIFYTRRSIFPEQFEPPSLDHLQFERLTTFPDVQVNLLKAETEVQSLFAYGQQRYYALCERVVWAATENGVYKLYLTLDQEHYKNLPWSDMRYDKIPSNSDFSRPVFRLCGTESVLASTLIPTAFKNQIMFQWFKDGVEIPALLGKLEAPLSEAGVYTIKITALCEQITVTSNPIVILKDALPDISFNYPPEITVCEGGSVTLNTTNIAGYNYRWFKNGAELPAENRNFYTAFTPGTYHVEVSNCAGQYRPSSTVRLNIDILSKPVLLHNKAVYCENDVAILSVDNPFGFKIRWDRNAIEMPQFRDHLSITPPGDGKYMVTFINENGCIKQSDAYDFVTHPLPLVNITRSSNRSLCYGETTKLSVNATHGATYLWSNGASRREIEVKDAGTYSVTVTSPFGCTAVSEPVVVQVNGQIHLARAPDVKICKLTGERVNLVAETGYVFYTWNGQKGRSNVLEVNTPGSYNLEVEDSNGCKATTVFNVLSKCNSIIAPNAFSPNGDGVNDVWSVSGLEGDPTAQILIYNRYGTLIFNTNGIKPVWEGSIKSVRAPVSTYYYVIKSKYIAEPIKGSITLIR